MALKDAGGGVDGDGSGGKEAWRVPLSCFSAYSQMNKRFRNTKYYQPIKGFPTKNSLENL